MAKTARYLDAVTRPSTNTEPWTLTQQVYEHQSLRAPTEIT